MSQMHGPQHKHNRIIQVRAQQSSVIAHYRVGVGTQLTLRGAENHFYSPQLQSHSLIVIQGSRSRRKMKAFKHQILR